VQSLKSACHRRRSQRRPGSQRPRNSLEVSCAEVRTFSDNDRVGFGNALETCREIWRQAAAWPNRAVKRGSGDASSLLPTTRWLIDEPDPRGLM
jgi:hypothetical protein